MSTTAIVAIVVIAAVIVIAALIAIATSRRSRRRERLLAERFGPEYERTVGQAESGHDRRAARHDLAERADRRDDLEIRPLPIAAREQYSQQWRRTQERFVDEPREAVGDAEQLLDAVMRERGYPVDGFEEQAELISVDHPGVVQNYRAAHRIQDRADHGGVTTEDLREAMLRYRSLFDELLAPV